MTRQEAIKAKCIDCIYDPAHTGTHLAQVEACTMTDCALYEFRPVTRATADRLKQEKIDNMTPEQRLAYEAKAKRARETLQK